MADLAHEISRPLTAAGPPAPSAQVPRSIIPLAGIPVVAVVLVLLILAIASDKLWPVEFFHVAAGGTWTAIDLFIGLLLGPIMASMSLGARGELVRRLMPKLALIIPTLVVCTLAAGWQLG